MIKLIHPLLHVYKVFESRKLKFVCLIKQNFGKQKNSARFSIQSKKIKLKYKKRSRMHLNHVVNIAKNLKKIA